MSNFHWILFFYFLYNYVTDNFEINLITFFRYDTDHSQFIDQHELQIMMEKLEAPQTYLGLKAMIKEVDEDQDGEISFREVSIDLQLRTYYLFQPSRRFSTVQKK